MLKMYTYKGNWVVVDGDRHVAFDTALDAWTFVMLLKEIRPKAPQVPKSLYPVRTLNPMPTRRYKKVVILQNG